MFEFFMIKNRHAGIVLFSCIKIMIKSIFKRLVYTPLDLSPRFTRKVNLSNTNLFLNRKNPA